MAFFEYISNRILPPIAETYPLNLEDQGRRRLFSIFLLLLIFPLFFIGLSFIWTGIYRYGILDSFLTLFCILCLVLIKRIKNPEILYRIVLTLFLFVLFYWINTGIFKGYASLWVLVYPLFAFYLLGIKEGSLWTFLASIITVSHFFIPALSSTGFVYETDFIVRHLFIFFLIIIFTYSYESMSKKYKNAMEAEHQKLNEEKERLILAKKEADSANSKLNEEITEKRKIGNELQLQKEMLEEMVFERTRELEKSNAMLASSETKYRLMADNITDMIWTADLNMHFTFISPSVFRIFGYTVNEAMNLTFDQWNTPASFEKVIQLFTEETKREESNIADPGRYINVELEHIKADSIIIPVEVTVSFLRDKTGKATGLVGITRDISERVKAQKEKIKIQEQLSQAQKMEAIGTLVGGIAHDFNNILGGIIGSLDIVSRLLKDDRKGNSEKIEKFLGLGMESSLRSVELIKQLLVLSRRHKVSLSPVDINDSLNHVVDICRNSLSKMVEIDYKKSEYPLVIMGDMIQIEQVLLNLCINSAHAMTIMVPEGEREGGILSIKSMAVKSDIIMQELYPEASLVHESWVKIEISDTGVGIDPEVQKRIFEPFFSTKNQEHGSGLGLATSYNIIRQHKGIIHVYSEPGKGTIFSVYLPFYRDLERVDLPPIINYEIIKGSGKILIIDDESAMLSVGKGFLEECGYTVLTASAGVEGIEIYKNNFADISAVLMDLSMPGMSGLEVCMELKKINSSVKVLLTSGMFSPESLKAAEKIGIKNTVNKPYLAHELSYKINEILMTPPNKFFF